MDMMDLLEHPQSLSRDAHISECGLYRYWLTRRWGNGPSLVFVMFNPSTADALKDDQTIRRCMYFARREGYDGITVLNMYAYRTTFPADMVKVASVGVDVVGPENLRWIQHHTKGASRVVFAWGGISSKGLDAHAQVVGDVLAVIPLETDRMCLGETQEGAPRHPSRLGNDVALVPYKRAAT